MFDNVLHIVPKQCKSTQESSKDFPRKYPNLTNLMWLRREFQSLSPQNRGTFFPIETCLTLSIC